MKRRILITTSIALLMLTGLAIRLFLQTEPRSSLALARFMPGGALAYAEFRDLDSLLGQWMSSAAHKRYFESANWKQFQTSRLYLRLQQRLDPIQAALGFELTEQRLGTLAGKQSAFAIYNIGELEALFITTMTQQEALASTLFKQRRAFRERSIDGLVYYVRQGTSTETQEKAEAGFAFAQGKLFVASSENLLRRALTNVTRESEDRLSLQIARLTDKLEDFKPHDISVWLDQKRLNTNRYFRTYWIHDNEPELTDIETALLDMEMTETEFRERRWFALSETASKDQQAISSLTELLRFAPAETQLLTVSPSKDIKILSRRVAHVLLGETPKQSSAMFASVAFSPQEEQSGEPPPSGGAGRYASLDERFNKDIDDPTSFPGDKSKRGEQPVATSESEERLVTRLMESLRPAQPAEFMSVSEATLDANQLFVSFNRALVIRLMRPDTFNPQQFENTVREEFAAQFVVQGIPAQLEWKITGDIHSLNQAVVDRGSAYAIIGHYLILANRVDYGSRVVQAYKGPQTLPQAQAAALQRYAQIHIQQGKGVYKHLMEMLAMPRTTSESNEAIDLFSDNIASLFDVVPDLRTATIETVYAAPFLREVATYSFEPPQPRSTRRGMK